jgi:hypothetical protein
MAAGTYGVKAHLDKLVALHVFHLKRHQLLRNCTSNTEGISIEDFRLLKVTLKWEVDDYEWRMTNDVLCSTRHLAPADRLGASSGTPPPLIAPHLLASTSLLRARVTLTGKARTFSHCLNWRRLPKSSR